VKTSLPGPVVRDDPSVVALVVRADRGDQDAWDEIVKRYSPLLWSICNRFQLNAQDRQDVTQTVWMLLVEQLGKQKLREPAALAGWLAITTQRECLHVVKAAHKSERLGTMLEDAMQFKDDAMIEEEVETAERNACLRAAFAELSPQCQRLLAMLLSDPPCSYAEISRTLHIPLGSIGPQRGRCLGRLRRSRALIAFVEGDPRVTVPGGEPDA
jgi:RNA polymerase sigma factor (sigma-70 family)